VAYHERVAQHPQPRSQNQLNSRDIGDLDRAIEVRRDAALRLSMSERLARVHELSKQMNAVKGAARSR
jgi:hypothetical protein